MSPLRFSALGPGMGGPSRPGWGSWEKPDRRPAPSDLWARATETRRGSMLGIRLSPARPDVHKPLILCRRNFLKSLCSNFFFLILKIKLKKIFLKEK